jgi:hypothetical protein
MKLLRVILVVYALAFIVGAVALSVHGGSSLFLIIYLIVNGAIVLVGTVFERGRYKPAVTSDGTDWQTTGERFTDGSSGKLMEVRYNARTGERDYVPVDDR